MCTRRIFQISTTGNADTINNVRKTERDIEHWKEMREIISETRRQIREDIFAPDHTDQKFMLCALIPGMINQGLVRVDQLIAAGYLDQKAATLSPSAKDSPHAFREHLKPTYGIMCDYLINQINRHLNGLYHKFIPT